MDRWGRGIAGEGRGGAPVMGLCCRQGRFWERNKGFGGGTGRAEI